MNILEGMFATARRAALVTAMLLAASAASAQKSLTLDVLFDPQQRVNFGGTSPSGLAWIDAARYAAPRGGRDGTEWTRVDAVRGSATPLFDASKMEDALAAGPGIPRAEARRLSRSRDLTFDATYSSVLVSFGSDLYVYGFATGVARRLTFTPALDERLPSFSPNGGSVAFVRDNNLFVVDVATARERQLTSDGTNKILNGILDWVYEEEIYGRGNDRGYWWSPDSSRLAFLRIDDNPVPTFTTVDFTAYSPALETWDYPKAGDPNPLVTLGVVATDGGAVTWVDDAKYTPADSLIVSVSWKPDGSAVVFQVQNRPQTWLDLNVWDVNRRSMQTLFRETSKFWIASEDAEPPTWLNDGSFVWLSERSGWRHAYHYRGDGTLISQITNGKWELRRLHGVDDARGLIFFSGTERSPIGLDVYRIKMDGSGLRRLSSADGTHLARFNPPMTMFIDRWSDVFTPPQTSVWKDDGDQVRVIDRNQVKAIEEYRLTRPEFVQVTARDGFQMEAMLIKPPNFDPSRRYPVYQFTYAGPHTQQVANRWGGVEFLFHQLLAQHGVIVWVCDNRTASGKGAESTWHLGRRFGESELRDIEDGLAWLKRQPWVDASRIGMHGWSYGGFMTAYAMTHSKSFVMGIAGGTVSDWRDYDTVYTERYLGLPEENPDGYHASSPRWAAADLHGALLLIHGEIDDNVHVSNTTQFVYELQRAQKPFQLMLYPKARHSVTNPAQVRHMRALMLNFILEHLKPARKPAS